MQNLKQLDEDVGLPAIKGLLYISFLMHLGFFLKLPVIL